MIQEANNENKAEILALWKNAYPNQNEDYLNFYFREIFDNGVCLTQEQDDRIVSSLEMNRHIIRLQGKQLMANYILGVSTLNDYRRRGHMKDLMNSAIDEASHTSLITLIKGFNPKIYERYGFEVVYYRKTYTIARTYLNKVSTARVSSGAQASELTTLYQKFTLLFDGYYCRDNAYYTLLLKELALGQKQMVVYRNGHNELTGYMIYQKKKNDIMVLEAIYLESVSLLHMLKKAIGMEKEISLSVSLHERLEKLFPLIIPKKQVYMMARINNIALFNKLYNVKIKNTKEAFESIKKPLWCHEYY
ncbi:MAG: GNAT family N-acetyltransferase [Longicatena sp.]